jgi:hypothetical protein
VLIFNAFIKTFLAEFHVKIYGLLYEDIESNKDTHENRKTKDALYQKTNNTN